MYFNTTIDGAGQPVRWRACVHDALRAWGAAADERLLVDQDVRPETFNFTPNAINRYAIGDRTPGLKRDTDGGLTLYIQGTSPGKDKESNWSPSPASGSLLLVMRTYLPGRGRCGTEMGASPLPEIGRFQVSREARAALAKRALTEKRKEEGVHGIRVMLIGVTLLAAARRNSGARPVYRRASPPGAYGTA